MDDEFWSNLTKNVLETFAVPELNRRQTAGALPDGFELYAVQVVMEPSVPNEVRFDEEVRFAASLRRGTDMELDREHPIIDFPMIAREIEHIELSSRLTRLSLVVRPTRSAEHPLVDLPFEVPGCSVGRLSNENVSDLQRLHERCADYIELVSGAPPAEDEAAQLLQSLPPGKSLDDKFVLGIYTGGELIGALDLIRDAPSPGQWWIGNLMIVPEVRGRGIGAAIYRACEQWLHTLGVESIGLCVQVQNPSALSFWCRMGFLEVDRAVHRLNALESAVVIMRRDLGVQV